MKGDKKIAVFIDAENISAQYVSSITAKIASEGSVLIQRAYADWSRKDVKQWQDIVASSPIHAIQQFHKSDNSQIKEAVDKAIIMDGVEIATTAPLIDTICLVSSDKGYSDFVMKLRALGKYVIGIGERTKIDNNSRYVKTCNEFIYIENLKEVDDGVLLPPDEEDVSKMEIEFSLAKFFDQCFDATPKIDENTVLLARLGESILKQKSDFDYGQYGYNNLVDLAKRIQGDCKYEIKNDEHGFSRTITRIAMQKQESSCVPSKETTQGEIVGKIFRCIDNYGFVRDRNDLEYFYYRNDAPKDIRDKLKKDVDVRCHVLKEPDKNASATADKNGRVKIIELGECISE